MAHQQWQDGQPYYAQWNNQYNYQYNNEQQNQYYASYPYYYQHDYSSPAMSQQQQQQQQQQQHAPASQPPHHSVINQLHEQTQQQQDLAALAAASITTALHGGSAQSSSNGGAYSSSHQPYQAYTPHHQRTVVTYNDIETGAPSDISARPHGTFCCNRWYRTPAAKEQHERNHIQCSDCSFSGIKAVMSEHMEVEHGKIPPEGSVRKKNKPDGVVPPNAPKIRTAEELTAWIEARKRNWPSEANVERKKREKAERAARGQLPEGSGKKRKHQDETEEHQRVPKIESMNALGAYGSDDEDGESDSDDSVDLERDAISAKDPTSMGKIALPTEKSRAGPRCRYFARGRCRHGDKCRYVHEKPTQAATKLPQVSKAEEKRSTLLRMLLAKEIREEQNVILQCFRHIIDNQFFGRAL